MATAAVAHAPARANVKAKAAPRAAVGGPGAAAPVEEKRQGRTLMPAVPSMIPALAPLGEPPPVAPRPPEGPMLPMQCKLVMGTTSDPLEAEADQMADRVMARGRLGGPERLRSWSARGSSAGVRSIAAPRSVHEVVGQGGQPLDGETRAFMERRFGTDFSRVRVHADAKSADSARAVGAEAFAVGHHIAFGAGAYDPRSASGKKLLAHELAHVVQQNGAAKGAQEATVRRRRVPSMPSLNELLEPAATDRAAHQEGLLRLIRNAWRELPDEKKKATVSRAAVSLLGKIEISLQSHGNIFQSSDDWNIQSVTARLLQKGANKGEVLKQSGNPLVRLGKKNPSISWISSLPAGTSGPVDMIQFTIETGTDDLRSNSTAIATLMTTSGTVLQRLWLKQRKDPEWDEHTTHSPAFYLGFEVPEDWELFAILKACTVTQLEDFARELEVAVPKDVLGDPNLIDAGPRPGTADQTNIDTLVTGADKVFDEIASGSRDSDISDVFGPSRVAEAKDKFAKAKEAMHRLQAAGKIVTDRSGYDAEAAVGGLTNPSQIALLPEAIDDPTNKEHIATMVHESTHAGGTGVTDKAGYIGKAHFTEMKEEDKINTAADFEVIAHRILTPAAENAYPGKKFIPAGTTVGGSTAPQLTQLQDAMAKAWDTFQQAWIAALNLHKLFRRVFKSPTDWNTVNIGGLGLPAGTHFADSLPFWSKVENMTIHKRTGIDPTLGKPSANPVTQIDIAQSESVIRRLAVGMFASDDKHFSEDDAKDLEDNATSAEKAEIKKGPDEEAKVLVTLVRASRVGEITGGVDRDVRAIERLADAKRAPNVMADLLAPKDPATFPD